MKLTKIQQQIVELLTARPRTALELLEAIWWVHPRDAPDISCIKAHVYNTNARLRYYRIFCKYQGRGQEKAPPGQKRGRGLGRTEGVYSIRKVKHGHSKRQPSGNKNPAVVEGAQSAGPARHD